MPDAAAAATGQAGLIAGILDEPPAPPPPADPPAAPPLPLPCPFCGTERPAVSDALFAAYVKCRSCFATGPLAMEAWGKENGVAAVEAWNNRAAAASPGGPS